MHNNPISLAEGECRRIWPQISRPDLIVSLGTGTGHPTAGKPGLVSRLWTSFMASLDGQKAWEEACNRLSEEHRVDYCRLNVELGNSMLALDDTSCMKGIQSLIKAQPSIRQACNDIAVSLLISSFYFELHHVIPQYSQGSYLCRGSIVCRLPGKAMDTAFRHLGQGDWAFSTNYHFISHFDAEADCCFRCGLVRKSVAFRVRNPLDQFCIYMHNSEWKRQISGFPTSLEWFVERQGLKNPFGPLYPSAVLRCEQLCRQKNKKRKGITTQGSGGKRLRTRSYDSIKATAR